MKVQIMIFEHLGAPGARWCAKGELLVAFWDPGATLFRPFWRLMGSPGASLEAKGHLRSPFFDVFFDVQKEDVNY